MTQENKSTTTPSTMDPKRNKSAREIEADIGETRNALSDDLKALSDKVSPAHIKHEAKQALSDAKNAAVEKAAEINDAAMELKDAAVEKAVELKDEAVEKAQQAAEAVSETIDEVGIQARRAGEVAWGFAVDNAVPLALIGIGAGWMFANQRRTRLAADDDYESDDDDYLTSNVVYDARSSAPVARKRQTAKKSGPKRAGEKLNRAASRAGDRAQAVYDKAGESLVHAEDALAQRASRGREIVTESLTRARDASREFAQANALAVAFGSLVAGVGVGLLLPSSARENQWLEPSRDRLRRVVGDARNTAREVGSAARETAKETISTLEGHAR